MSWFRTYRPTRVADLHLVKVREALQQLMANGKVPQVLLFAGPKGTGKTSTARIIAAMLNDPHNAPTVEALFFGKDQPQKMVLLDPDSQEPLVQQIQQGTALNVQELDAASHRGIDDIRALKERVYLAPQQGLVSVYILDEAHMLTTEAFNALLKLLEEPPAHAVFILATTELNKVPSTVVSRATTLTFTKATPAELTAALQRVVDQEKLKVEPAALELIALRADGSFRDGIKLLETVASQAETITAATVEALGLSSLQTEAEHLLKLVLAKDETQVVITLAALRDTGVDQTQLHRALLTLLHTHLLRALGLEPGEALASERVCHFLLTELQTLPLTSPIPLLGLELKLLELIFRAKAKNGGGSSSGSGPSVPTTGSGTTRSSKTTGTVKKSGPGARTATPLAVVTDPRVLDELELVEPTPELQAAQRSESLVIPSPAETQALLDKWSDFLEAVKAKNTSIAAVLRSAKPIQAADGSTQVAVFYKFHQEQLQQPKFRQILDECVQTVIGTRVPFQFILAEPDRGAQVEAATGAADTVPSSSSAVTTATGSETLAALAAEVLI